MATTLKPLNEQVIVITGASSGIGLATTMVAAASGAKLVVAARSEDTLRQLASDIRANGGEATYQAGDVGRLSDVRRIADKAIARFARIDTWINVAGVSIYGRLTQASDEDNRRLFDTNFWGTVYGSKVALPHLEMTRGALINIGRDASDTDSSQQGLYAVSKAAVKGFTAELRAELERDCVPVSVKLIEPGATDTPFPHHARNYTAKAPTVPESLSDPFQVAERILEAATDEKDSIKRELNPLPWQPGAQPTRNPDGALHRASGSGKVFGGGRLGVLAALLHPR
jgi:short-subunit dehydrogenase